MVFSFAYELPVIEATSMDRVNPRLFDLATIFGIIFIHPKIRRSGPLLKQFRIWQLLVLWFTFCSIAWVATYLPWDKGQFSLFYSFKYLQGLYVIYLVLRIPLAPDQKRVLHYAIVASGIFIGLYCIPEYMSGSTQRNLAGGKVIYLAPGTLLGPLGATYGHLAAWSGLAFAMALSLIRLKNPPNRWVVIALALFVAWPGLTSGSRSGLLSIVAIFGLAVYYLPGFRNRALLMAFVATLGLTVAAVNIPSIEKLRGSSRSLERLLGTEEAASSSSGFNNTILDRVGIGEDNIQGYTLEMYKWQGWLLPVIGGGFYVVPHTRNNHLVYRVGYGIHNGFLFAFEQGGLIALVLFVTFLAMCFKRLKIMKRSFTAEDASFAIGIWMFFLITLMRMWVGGPLWLSTGTENFGTFFVIVILLASRPSGPWRAPTLYNSRGPSAI
ncbi:MAG: hypothetical protein ABJN62_12720 [Halioglobus sp.]